MRFLITGAAGMLGHDVRAAAVSAGHGVAALGRAELDITDAAAVREAIDRLTPDCVINCAAFTDVDGAESNYAAAELVNAEGPRVIARASANAGTWLLHISSDYVFDGAKREPYIESDATGPLSAYGQSKLGGEQAIAREAPGRHTIVRSSWLFGPAGPCFPATILRLAAERDELTVVNDQRGCPTFTGHLAGALIELAQRRVPGIVHVAGSGDCSWFEFAQEIVRRSGHACNVLPASTASLVRPAPRPAYSVLGTERGDVVPRLAHWREGLSAFMDAAVRA